MRDILTKRRREDRLNIVYVYQGEWPRGATRVAKQVNSLARAGHSVHLVCRNYRRAPRLERWGEGVVVHRLPSVRANWVNRALNFPFFLNPAWLVSIWGVARRIRADCIIVADLPLAPTALWIGRRLGLPVHYDMAEVYPEFLKTLWTVGHLSLVDRVVRSPRAAEVLERHVLRHVSSISVVCDESRDRAVARGAAPESLTIVGNTPENVDSLLQLHPFPTELEPYRQRPRALFIGVLIADRGVTEAVDAFQHVVHEIPDAVFVIVGDGPDRGRLLGTIARLRLERHVVPLGWRDHASLAALYQHCHVGLLPFLDTPHVRVTMANKLFDYMAAGIPVLGSDLPPIRRILDETRAGVLFRPGVAKELATGLIELFQDPVRAGTLGANGRRWVRRKYSWKVDEVTFVDQVEALGSRARARALENEARVVGSLA